MAAQTGRSDLAQVSVIIPAYNRLESLKRAVDSVRAQSYKDYQVIVVDDGSDDGTSGYLNEQKDLLSFYQENAGVSAARNFGIKNSKSKYIALLDSDDRWLPKKLEMQIKAFKENPQMRVCHTEEIWIRNGKRVNQMKKHQKFGGDIFEKCLPLCAMSPSSILIERSVFDEIDFFDESLPACEDYDLWLKITSKMPVCYIETPLIEKYGGHEDQLSRKYQAMDRFRIRSLDRIISSGDLAENQLVAAKKMLETKLKIYMNGLRKRSKIGELEKMELILDRHGFGKLDD